MLVTQESDGRQQAKAIRDLEGYPRRKTDFDTVTVTNGNAQSAVHEECERSFVEIFVPGVGFDNEDIGARAADFRVVEAENTGHAPLRIDIVAEFRSQCETVDDTPSILLCQ